MSLDSSDYVERGARFSEESARHRRRSNAYSAARLAVAFAGVVVVTMGIGGELPSWGWLAGALLAVFLGLVVAHDRVLARVRHAEELVTVNREAEKRRRHDWSDLSIVAGPEDRPIVKDLQLFGRASLFQRLGTVATASGRARLTQWLLQPAEPDEIRARQAAVDQLAPALDFRQEIEVRGRLSGAALEDGAGFVAWAEDEPWLIRRPGLLLSVRVLAAVLLVATVLWGLDVVPGAVVGLLVAASAVVSKVHGGRVHGDFSRLSSRRRRFEGYGQLFAALADLPGDAPRLMALRERLGTAHRELDRLTRLVDLSDVRYAQLGYLIVQLFTLWDFHVLHALERWQMAHGRLVRGWLAALAEVDALSALAVLRHDEPGWAFPEVDARHDALTATGLGHPLLPDGRRVVNDVTVGPAGTYVLLTGSNMSGKSTLLRAVGVNVVLANAGGPVCAAAMSLPPLVLGTSILVEDSLEDGVSYFLSELRRLKAVVDLGNTSARRTLYLLDEVLRGTNSGDRQVAVRRVLRHLVGTGAIGIVSTHDQGLVDLEGLTAARRAFHFEETIETTPEGTRMTFDYRLRPGVATTTNALRLLEAVGLPS